MHTSLDSAQLGKPYVVVGVVNFGTTKSLSFPWSVTFLFFFLESDHMVIGFEGKGGKGGSFPGTGKEYLGLDGLPPML